MRFEKSFLVVISFISLVLMFFLWSQQSAAQADGFISTTLTLEQDQESYDLGPALYVTKDPNRILKFKDVFERHIKGPRGDAVDGNIIPLGTKNNAHWVVFTVVNRSWTDDWVLSFGDQADGRLGMVSDLFVYEHYSKTRYVDTVSQNENPFLSEQGTGNVAIPITLPKGKKSLFFLYLVPDQVLPTALPMKILTAQAYQEDVVNPYSQENIISLFLLFGMGFFAALLIIKKHLPHALPIFFFAAQLQLYLVNDNTLFSSSSLSVILPSLLFGAAVIFAIYITKTALGFGKSDRNQNRVILVTTLVTVSAFLVGYFLIPEKNAVFKPVILYLPGLFCYLILSLLSFAQLYNNRTGAVYFSLAWGSLFLGGLITAISSMGIITPSAALICSYWYASAISAIMIMIGSTMRIIKTDYQRHLYEVEAEEEEESVKALVTSKEASENVRLRRLIEHERAVMNELREREIQQNEEMRRAKDTADEANRAKSAFLAVVSHEIRTPMTGIMGMVRLLLESKLSKEQKDYTQTIQDSGDAMLSLLNDILDFEKIESGSLDLEHIEFDLSRLINGISRLMSGHAASKNIYLKVDIGSDVPDYVIGDPVRLRQVLLNLAGNSIKFTENGGVTLSVQKIVSDSQSQMGQSTYKLRFSVIDTGVGISKEAQKNLFSPFSQADSSISRKYGGTGLGLVISQRLIEAMGGKIEIDSIEGSGSTFYFTILMQEGQEDQTDRKDQSVGVKLSSQTSEKSLHILVVEDNEINQKLMNEFISRMGHKTVMAGTGEEAIERVEAEDFDMVLMDIELPGISGKGATKAIRALPNKEKASVPVIALTGNVREEDIRECFAANMNAHLAKPVDPTYLKTVIDKVINSNLDNPVELPEEADRPATQINQIEISDKGLAINKKNENGEVNKDAFNTDDTLEEKDDFSEFDQESLSVQDYEEAPIKALAMGLEDFSIDDEELDEDSFDEAINQAEKEDPVSETIKIFEADDLAFEDEKDVSGAVNRDNEAEALVVDHSMLAGLKEAMDEISYKEMIEGLVDKAEEIVEAMQGLDISQDEVVMARAHELKGMTGNFGLNALAKAASDIEDAVRDREVDKIMSVVKSLPDLLNQSKEELEKGS